MAVHNRKQQWRHIVHTVRLSSPIQRRSISAQMNECAKSKCSSQVPTIGSPTLMSCGVRPRAAKADRVGEHRLAPAAWAEFPALSALPPSGRYPDGTLAWRVSPASGNPHIPSTVPSIVSLPPDVPWPCWASCDSFMGRRGWRTRHLDSLG